MKKRNSCPHTLTIIKELNIKEFFDDFVCVVEKILYSNLSHVDKLECLENLISVYRALHPKN